MAWAGWRPWLCNFSFELAKAAVQESCSRIRDSPIERVFGWGRNNVRTIRFKDNKEKEYIMYTDQFEEYNTCKLSYLALSLILLPQWRWFSEQNICLCCLKSNLYSVSFSIISSFSCSCSFDSLETRQFSSPPLQTPNHNLSNISPKWIHHQKLNLVGQLGFQIQYHYMVSKTTKTVIQY